MDSMITDRSLLEAALIGYQSELERINEAIGAINAELNGGGGGGGNIPSPFLKPRRKRRKMSAAARKRIGAATKLRWERWRKAQKA